MKQGWEIKTIADVCTFIKNGANIKQERGAGGVPITRIETLSGGAFNRDRLGYANLATPDKYLSYVLEYGDLLFSHINSKTYIGRTVVYVPENDEQIIHGMNLLRLKLDFDLMSPFFFQYYTRTDKFRAQVANRRKDAVNQSSITTTDIKTISLPVPPIAEQEKIVAELDCLSGIIEKKKQQLKELDALAQSIFYEMFGDPVENDKGWEVKTYGSEFQISSGGTPDTKNNLYWDNGDISWIGSNLCHDEIIYKNDGKYITKDGFDNSSAKEYKSGYVLVALVGATIGRTALLRFNTTTNQNVAGINVPANENFVPEFIFYHLQKLYELFMGIGNGKFKMANLRFIRELPLIVPSLSLQQDFASKIEAIEKQKELIAKSIKETETLCNSRMDYYFN